MATHSRILAREEPGGYRSWSHKESDKTEGLNIACYRPRATEGVENTKVNSRRLSSFWPHCIACRILVPRPGIEPMPVQGKHEILTTELPLTQP